MSGPATVPLSPAAAGCLLVSSSQCGAIHQAGADAPLEAGASDAMLLWFVAHCRTQYTITQPKQVSAASTSNIEA
jgi:hypothetical protein